jgi:hypothetical protein
MKITEKHHICVTIELSTMDRGKIKNIEWVLLEEKPSTRNDDHTFRTHAK